MDFKNYECDGQMSLFDVTGREFKIDKPIRLIELFAGVGSQAMALRDLGADFEHYRVVEFDKYAVASYNAIHGTNFPTMDVTKIAGADLGIEETDKHCYILTYSFPCQDLSLAGKGKGMQKGSGTRSGLLWEVERLLNEVEHLPQVLLMENVPQVHGKKNMDDFQSWISFLEGKGYSNFWQDLNAKDYGVAQSRNRCFMVSILGDWNYTFPKPIPLTKTMKDYLLDDVDEKYYINNEKASKLIAKLIADGTILEQSRAEQSRAEQSRAEQSRAAIDLSNINDNARGGRQPMIIDVVRIGGLYDNEKKHQMGSVYDQNGLCPTIDTCTGGNRQPIIVEEVNMEVKQLGFMDNGTGKHQSNTVYDTKELSPTITTITGGTQQIKIMDTVCIKQATAKGYIECEVGGVADLSYPTSTTRRGRVQDMGRVSPTITATETGVHRIESKYRIRKLTPLETWRLMDFSDEDFYKAEAVHSNTQLYKQAGNSIVRNVLVAIFGQMLPDKEEVYKETR